MEENPTDCKNETKYLAPVKVKKHDTPFELQISVNLIHSAQQILRILEHATTQADRLNDDPSSFNFYIDTYLKFLKLKAQHPELRLIPSLEVEWVWFSHVLRPKYYEAYCMNTFGKYILHDFNDFFLGHEDPSALKETAELYEKTFGEPYLFDEIPHLENKEIKYVETADVFNDWNWLNCLKSCKNYPQPEFFQEGEKGYYHFLRSVHESGFTTGPPVNIDLWWHAHQVKSLFNETENFPKFQNV
eukprot:TRINITY_DN1223_c0_g1_i5.p1 TRINITY_DN1223_c0_g1~~TRINITY_DN1223_c0_g1_i5.p1  ORF type:complete len:245 (+),score=33.78 TRINITY_DN1223_c0_g1_i5:336-1070(+)